MSGGDIVVVQATREELKAACRRTAERPRFGSCIECQKPLRSWSRLVSDLRAVARMLNAELSQAKALLVTAAELEGRCRGCACSFVTRTRAAW
jgi:hypothetical protein